MHSRKFFQETDIKIVGIEARTSNTDEYNSSTAKIGGLWAKLFQENIKEQVPHKTQPENLYEIYIDYESDEHEAYTVVLGYEVTDYKNTPEGLVVKTLPAGNYIVFTTDRGVRSSVIREAWQRIWQMDAATLGGERRYSGDFEIYDERGQNPEDAEIDIYIAIK